MALAPRLTDVPFVMPRKFEDADAQVVPVFDPKAKEKEKPSQSQNQIQRPAQNQRPVQMQIQLQQQRPAPKIQANPMPILSVQNSNQNQNQIIRRSSPALFSGQSATFQQLQPQISAAARASKRPHAEFNGAIGPVLNSPSLSTADSSTSNSSLTQNPEGNSTAFKKPKAVLNANDKEEEESSSSQNQKSLLELVKKVEAISRGSNGVNQQLPLPLPFPSPLQFKPIFIQVERITIDLPLKRFTSVHVLATRLANERKVHQALFDQLVKIGDQSNSSISIKERDYKVCLEKILRSLFLPEVWRQVSWTGTRAGNGTGTTSGKFQFKESPIQHVAFQALRFHHPSPNPTEEELKTATQNWIRINAK